MQPATCNGVRVRTTADCNVIFYAVSLGILPLVSRRLSIDERRAIQSGCVFVWEERSPTIEAVGVRATWFPTPCSLLTRIDSFSRTVWNVGQIPDVGVQAGWQR